MHVLKKTVKSLLDENFIYARALHYLGVDFFNYEEATLAEVCRERNIDHQRLVRSFYHFDTKSRIPFQEIREYPLPLVVAYLKFAHQAYIKDSLPYIGRLLNQVDTTQTSLVDLIEVFPFFIEDYIKHIYQEEDEVFGYIHMLQRIRKNGFKGAAIVLLNKKPSLQKMLTEHQSEDEMAPLRELVEEVKIDSLLTDVIVKEIRAFDREILYHAAIENEILFPKAIALEGEILKKVKELSALN